MAEVQTSESSTGETINQLYWDSDRTVDEIVDELGIGRNTLYSAVRPQPAGASCPDCGEGLVFTNRSNRSSSTATCRTCGREVDLADELPEPEIGRTAARDPHRHDHRHETDAGWSRWRDELAAVPAERAVMIGGAAVLGLVLGAVAARTMRG